MLTKKKNIMIIANEISLSATLEVKLKEQNYNVKTTLDCGDHLKNIINKNKPDLIIISMALSCVESIELTLRVRRWCCIPIILVSSWSETIRNVPQNGEKCQLIKIDTLNDIITKVESTFSRN